MIVIFEVATVLVLRAHYTMDVFHWDSRGALGRQPSVSASLPRHRSTHRW